MSHEADQIQEKNDEFNDSTSFYSYFVVLLFATVLADQLVFIINNALPEVTSRVSEVFGNYTFPILLIFFMLAISRIISIFISEINIESPIPFWQLSVAVLILVHPVVIFWKTSSIDIIFLWRLNRTEEFIVTLFFSSIMYIVAAYGIMQILLRSEKEEKSIFANILKTINEDILIFFATIFAFLYLYQEVLQFGFGSIELSMSMKIILFTFFLFMIGPSKSSSSDMDKKSNDE